MNNLVSEDRLVSADTGFEDRAEGAVRPENLDAFVGQKAIRENLEVFVKAAKNRGKALDHVLLYGPPGLGKTSLAHIVAKEMGVGLRSTSGPVIEKSGDLAAVLTSLEPYDVLFIDEIHRLNAHVEEILYPAMEDGKLDIMIGEGPSARTVKVDLPPFTLVGATTRAGLLTNPLRDRFGVQFRMEFYDHEELVEILNRACLRMGVNIEASGAIEIARRSRGTPRIAHRLLRRVNDFADVKGTGHIDRAIADVALTALEVDAIGLDKNDQRYLSCIMDKFSGGPVGLDTIAAAIGESKDTIEDVLEPYLIQLGFIQRTPRGRVTTINAYQHFGRIMPSEMVQSGLLA